MLFPIEGPIQADQEKNYDNLLRKFLYNEETEEFPIESPLKNPNIKDIGAKYLKEGLFSMINDLKNEENKENNSIAKGIFQKEMPGIENNDNSTNNINKNIKKETILNANPHEITFPQGQVFVEGFMNLINSTITQINNAIINNIQKPKENQPKQRQNKETSSESEESNSFYHNYEPNYIEPFYKGPSLVPINPNKFFEDLSLSSDRVSKGFSKDFSKDFSKGNLVINENESQSEGQLQGGNDGGEEEEWVSQLMKESREEDLSEGEIRLPKERN